MKKYSVCLLLIFLLSWFPVVVSAEEGKCSVDVKITSDTTNIKVGESIILTATSIKQGSSYQVNWDGAEDQGTILNTVSGEYVSVAVFSADKPGTYKVEYSIVMQAGNSGTYFKGKVVETINVYEEDKKVIGAEIRDLTITPVIGTDGITAYSALGTTYVLWSDNTSDPYGTVYFYFQENEYSKTVDVTFNMERQVYTYSVLVTRPDISN